MLAVIGGWEKMRVKEYLALLLLLEAGVMGVFMSLDLLLFFLFWEVELAPMFLLIGIWGNDTLKHGMPGRIYSAWKFLLYTFFGSIFMLAGILLLYFKMGGNTASMPVSLPRSISERHQSRLRHHGRLATADLPADLPGFRRQDTRCSRSIPGCPMRTPTRRLRSA